MLGIATMEIDPLSLAISIMDLDFTNPSRSRPTIFHGALRHSIGHGMLGCAKKAAVQKLVARHVFMAFPWTSRRASDIVSGISHVSTLYMAVAPLQLEIFYRKLSKLVQWTLHPPDLA